MADDYDTTKTDGTGIDAVDAEALERALARARARHSQFGADELDRIGTAAVAFAGGAGRDDREIEALVEAEFDRLIEEQTVLGTPGSVLPTSGSAPAEIPLALRADEPEQKSNAESYQLAEPTVVQDDARPAEAPALRLRTGTDYVLAAAALRFHHGREPAEIAHELNVERDYYAQCVQWFLQQVEPELNPPPHVNRDEMRLFAGGLTSIEQSFRVERHARECRSCALYLADLLEGATAMVEPSGRTGRIQEASSSEAGEAVRASTYAEDGLRQGPLATQGGRARFTTKDVWGATARPPQRQRLDVPFMTMKAESLRRYMPAADPIAAALAAQPIEQVTEDVAERSEQATTCPLGQPPADPLVARIRDRFQVRRALVDRLPSWSHPGWSRRGYATALTTLVVGLGAVEGGAAMTGSGSPALTAFDDFRNHSGGEGSTKEGSRLANSVDADAGGDTGEDNGATDGRLSPLSPGGVFGGGHASAASEHEREGNGLAVASQEARAARSRRAGLQPDASRPRDPGPSVNATNPAPVFTDAGSVPSVSAPPPLPLDPIELPAQNLFAQAEAPTVRSDETAEGRDETKSKKNPVDTTTPVSDDMPARGRTPARERKPESSPVPTFAPAAPGLDVALGNDRADQQGPAGTPMQTPAAGSRPEQTEMTAPEAAPSTPEPAQQAPPESKPAPAPPPGPEAAAASEPPRAPDARPSPPPAPPAPEPRPPAPPPARPPAPVPPAPPARPPAPVPPAPDARPPAPVPPAPAPAPPAPFPPAPGPATSPAHPSL